MKKWTQVVIAAAILAVMVFGSLIVTYYTDWLWFKDVGYQAVFIKTILTKVILFIIGSLVFFAIFYVNVSLSRRFRPKFGVSYLEGILKLKVPLIDRLIDRVLLALAVIFSIFAGSAASNRWEEALLFINTTAFGVKDPIFNMDLSFFVFQLPVYRFIWGFLFTTIVISAVFAMAVHVVDGAIQFVPGGQKFAEHVKAHISSLAAVVCVMFALGFRLLQYGLLYSSRGVAFGASYTDVHAELPVFGILMVVSLVTAALFLFNIRVKGWRLPIIAVALLGGALVLVGGIYPAIVQQYKVSPNEIAVEKPYIKRNIEFTRKAYGLDKVESKEYKADQELTAQSLETDKGTVENIRLWDWRPLTKTFNQLQAIRLYYDFADVDIDRYSLKGKYTQVTVAARELNADQLPDTAKTWVNQHLVYTHGYGIVMNPVNKITAEGLPELIVKDIPPVSDVLKLDVPQIYFGEKTNDFVLVGTDTNEFDYPKGDKNQYSKFTADAGVSIGGIFNKLMFAARFGSLKLLLSSTLTADSKVLFHRNISERVNEIAPFLQYDRDPYVVAARDGSGKTGLYWIYDAYTMTSMYPYSKPYAADGSNYIRNSVKVVISAYDGTTDFYLVDDKDPIAKAYSKMFPGLLKPGSEMPAELKKHRRYPEDLFNIQAYMYTTYHMLDPQVFYNKEDMWQIANEMGAGTAAPMDPYYMIMKLPGEKTTDFRLITPFTPANKNNMVGWLSADCDGADYGRLIVYKFSKDKLIFGPMQIEARINQDPTISQFLTLVSQRGSTISKGPLLVIPLAGSLIYVQPLYIQAEQGELPELKRVFVSYGEKVFMEPTLEAALQRLFGAPVPAVAPQTPGQPVVTQTAADLINQSLEHYNKAIEAQKAGDWATYGTEIKALEDTLNKLKAGQ